MLSGVVTVVNKLWEVICKNLTLLEAHSFYSDFRRWECFKVFTFKIVNIVVLYLVKSLAFPTGTPPTHHSACSCDGLCCAVMC